MIPEYMDWRNRKMRDILFRGKRTDNGKWVRDSETYIRDGDGIWLNDFSEEAGNEVVRVERETLGQYTGFRDEYGKEIYEGDIVRKTTKDGYPDNLVGEIVFKDGLFGIKRQSYYGLSVSILVKSSEWVDGNASGTSTYEYEVIGNIYDDTEFLKEYGKDF